MAAVLGIPREQLARLDGLTQQAILQTRVDDINTRIGALIFQIGEATVDDEIVALDLWLEQIEELRDHQWPGQNVQLQLFDAQEFVADTVEPVVETGVESSNTSAAVPGPEEIASGTPSFECAACLEDFAAGEIISLQQYCEVCQHHYCVSCFEDFFRSALDGTGPSSPHCCDEIDFEQVRHLLNNE